MNGLSKWRPDGLASRFTLLLTVALVVANLVALGLMTVERQRLDRDAFQSREVERIISLLPAIEAAAPELRRRIARDSSTRLSRVDVRPEPIVSAAARDKASASLTAELAAALPDRDVRAAIRVGARRDDVGDDRADRGSHHDARTVIAVSIALAGPEGARTQWLNMVSRGRATRPPGIESEVFLLVLGVSLICVLGVGLVFVRRLTRPLGALAQAARAAGQGDRTAKAPETGAREMREAARAFNAMQSEISQFDAERMRMLAAVGHDLRTPMTSLRIRAEMVEDEEQRTAMIRTLDEMTVMAAGLVTYAREGHDGEQKVEVDLEALLAPLCAERGAQFKAQAHPKITGRPVGLGRAIGNLIDNALRYGGAASVTLAATRTDALVTVDDTGPGIAPDRLEDMFQPFVRGDTSRNLDTGGAGLGLSITRTIIAGHGGTIALENRAGGGLRARVSLPLSGN